MILAFITLLLIGTLIMFFIDVNKENKNEEKSNNERYYHHEERYSNLEYDNESKIIKILNLIIKDFNNGPYKHKYTIFTVNRNIFFNYKFNNGYQLRSSENFIQLTDKSDKTINSFLLSNSQYIKLLNLIKEIEEKSINQNNQKQHNQNNQQKYKQNNDASKNTTGNTRLDKILEKIKLREDQLRKMKSNDPERTALVNELNVYKNIANKIKLKNK